MADDLARLDSNIESLSIIGCQSENWSGVFDQLCTLSHLKELILDNCDCGDCGSGKSVANLKGLTSLTMSSAWNDAGKCRLTDRAVEQIATLAALKDLNICTTGSNAELNYYLSDQSFQLVLKKLKGLTSLKFPVFGPGFAYFSKDCLT